MAVQRPSKVRSPALRRSALSRRTTPCAASGCPDAPALRRAPSFFARELVAMTKAPERGHADLSPLPGEPRLQLGQGDVGHLVERGVDQAGMGLRLVRKPVAPLRLRPRLAFRAAQSRPADRARRAHPETLSRLPARQARIDGGQDAGAKVEGQWLWHAGRPPSPARTLNQITPAGETLP